ncbi:hypothetical protein [Psychrobacter jeotgali]|uniref:hypothetical protein n=1 Tax=Psychrobacter jeotgali TaxID=179010 RepID=UPI00191B2E66|nr:hypothetical protein [Psychrobacter jeotgali]
MQTLNTLLTSKLKTSVLAKLSLNQLCIASLLTLTALPLYAQGSQTAVNSCDIYKIIEQAEKPLELSEFKQTPNGINVYSDNLTLQVANFQLCQATHPFSNNEDAISQYAKYEQTLSRLADRAIIDFPNKDSLSREQIKQFKSDGIYYQEQVVELYFQMALNYYLGEFVPKNDEKTIQYMSKVVDYFQQNKAESIIWLDYMVSTGLVRKNRRLSRNNPITLQHKTETGLGIVSTALLSKAGHLDSKAGLLLETFDYWRSVPTPPSQTELEQYLQPILPALVSYAEQGSYKAIEGLEKIYTELSLFDKRYERKAGYWQQQSENIPQENTSWQ